MTAAKRKQGRKALALCASTFISFCYAEVQGAVTFVDLEPDMRTNQLNVDFNVDLDGNGFRDVWFRQTTGTSGLNARSTSSIRIQSVHSDVATQYPLPLPDGTLIGPMAVGPAEWVNSPAPFNYLMSAVVVVGSNAVNFGLFPGHDEYMGIELTLPDGIHYGYIRVEVGVMSTLAVIKNYAFETMPGVPIIAGSVPEPGRIALLIAGSLGLIATRRRCQSS